jgi:thiamine biosynthesis lipoprotein
MGCPCAVHLEADDAARAERAYTAVRAELARLDAKYSHYRADSLLAQFAARAGDECEVDGETADLLDFSAELYRQSGGRFDVTAGALTRLWDGQDDRLPSPAEIARARATTGWERAHWCRPRLRLAPGMRLDLGGVVKEYAADRAAQLCREAGIGAGVIDLGGDLALIGPHRDGSPWRVGIRAPRARDQAAAAIDLAQGALATSGDYERVRIVEGRRYSHIVDPTTGWPVAGFASVSVVADSCLVAGAAATLAMLLGVGEGKAYLEALGLPHLCIDDAGRVVGDIELRNRVEA